MISIEEATSRVAIVGAAGKMGRGIALLLAEKWPEAKLVLIDREGADFEGLSHYLGEELVSRVSISTSLESARGATLLLESIDEDVEAKRALLASVELAPAGVFLSNTSSIPISELEKGSAYCGRVAGFHFFNPAPVQPLIELIVPEGQESLRRFTMELASSLGKVVIESADIAGFISNGYLQREIRYACGELEELGLPFSEGVLLLDQITERLLVRPMGIFRQIDYIGLDVCSHIGEVMHQFNPGSDFSIPIIETMVARGLVGGLGRPGFLAYEGGRPVQVYDIVSDRYTPLPPPLELPLDPPAWRSLKGEESCERVLADHFLHLFDLKGSPARIARDYLLESREIAQQLARDGVAKEQQLVGDLLQWGMGHLYAPLSLSDHPVSSGSK